MGLLGRLCVTALGLTISTLAGADDICEDFPYFAPKTGPFMQVNCDFHHAYEARIDNITKTFGAVNGRPIILELGGRLVLKYQGVRHEVDITPTPYPEMKAFLHSIVAVYLFISDQEPGKLTTETLAHLQDLVTDIVRTRESLMHLSVAPNVEHALDSLYKQAVDFLQITLKSQQWSTANLEDFYKKIKAEIFIVKSAAAHVEIAALDKALATWLKKIPKQQKPEIGIVVAIAHQARARGLTVDYFAKKFKKKICVGAQCEDGMVIIEGKYDEDSALSALARHYLDRQMGKVLFAAPLRMQYDLLSK